MRFAAVVLSFNNAATTVELVARLRSTWRSPRHELSLLVVDNGSAVEHRGPLRQLRSDAGPVAVDVVRNESNLGFAGGVNRAVASVDPASYDGLVLLNDDLDVDGAALEHLLDEFEGSPDIWVLAPAIAHVRHGAPLVGGRVTWMFRVRYHRSVDPPELRDVEFVPFTFVILREKPRDGRLLEDRVFFGEEDVDYALRCRRQGRRVVVDPRILVHHEASQTRKRNSTATAADEQLLGLASRSVTVRAAAGPVRWVLWRAVSLAVLAGRWALRQPPTQTLRLVASGWRETDRRHLDRDDFYRLAKLRA